MRKEGKKENCGCVNSSRESRHRHTAAGEDRFNGGNSERIRLSKAGAWSQKDPPASLPPSVDWSAAAADTAEAIKNIESTTVDPPWHLV